MNKIKHFPTLGLKLSLIFKKSGHLIHDADLLALRVPGHASDDGLVPVVDHLLVPAALVEHPHDDKTILKKTNLI